MITEKDIEDLRNEFAAMNLPYAKKVKASNLLYKMIIYLKKIQKSLSGYRKETTGFNTDQLINIVKISALLGLDENSMAILIDKNEFIDYIANNISECHKVFSIKQIVYLSRFYDMYCFEFSKEPKTLNDLKEYINAAITE